MKQLTDSLSEKFITRMSAIHDCHDTLTNSATLTTTPAKYTNDAAERDWGTEELWDSVNSIVDCSGLVVGSKIDIILDSVIASGNQGATILVEFICPNNGNPFTMKQKIVVIERSVEYPEDATWVGYVGPEVQQYGVEIWSSVVTGTVVLTKRKILVRA